MAAGVLMAASMGLDVVSGVFGYLAGQEAQATAESRARLLRAESEAEAQRYAEQGQKFKASQKLAYLKSGVELTGSPLDVLDETALTIRENLSAIRAGGEARAVDMEAQGLNAQTQGRAALLGGIIGAGKTGIKGAYDIYKNNDTATTPRNNTVAR